MDITTLSTWIFGAMLAAGALYLLVNIVTGGLDIGGDIDLELPNSGADGIGLNVIAVFCTGAGAMGLVGGLSGWNPIVTILVSLLMGLLIGRLFQKFLGYTLRQQSNALITRDDLIGRTARITVNIPAGQVGEAMIEDGERMKYPVRHRDGHALTKGTQVQIVDVQAGRLIVREEQKL